jgi:hypothetical protein
MDYCEHLRKMRGKVLPDGRQVGMLNTFPKFFDLSFVFIGADRTAKVMAHLMGNAQKEKPTSYFYFSPEDYSELTGKEKAASAQEVPITKEGSAFIKSALWGGDFIDKTSELGKESDIVKRVVSNFSDHMLDKLNNSEQEIPSQLLEDSAPAGLDRILSTLTGLGILLKPKEFQRITIICMKKKPLADELDGKNILFRPTEESHPMARLSSRSFAPQLADIFSKLMPDRSFHAPFLMRRAVKIKVVPKENYESITHPFLDKISAAYNNYREQLIKQVVPLTKQAIFEGPPMVNIPPETSKPGAVPVVYMINSHAPRAPEIKDPSLEKGFFESFIRKHPWLVASMFAGGALHLARKFGLK